MLLTQLLSPSNALKLPTIIRNPQGATKLGDGKGRVPSPVKQTWEGDRVLGKRMQKLCRGRGEGKCDRVILVLPEEGYVIFLIIINT